MQEETPGAGMGKGIWVHTFGVEGRVESCTESLYRILCRVWKTERGVVGFVWPAVTWKLRRMKEYHSSNGREIFTYKYDIPAHINIIF